MVDGISLLTGLTMGAGIASYLWGTRYFEKCKTCKELTILKETSANARWLAMADAKVEECEELRKKYLELLEEKHDLSHDLEYKNKFYEEWSAKKGQAETVNRIKARDIVYGEIKKPLSQRVREIQDIDLDDDEIEDFVMDEEEETKEAAVFYDPPTEVRKDARGRMEAADGFPWPEKRKFMMWFMALGYKTTQEMQECFAEMGYELNLKTLANNMTKAKQQYAREEMAVYDNGEERVIAPRMLAVRNKDGRPVCRCCPEYYLTTLTVDEIDCEE